MRRKTVWTRQTQTTGMTVAPDGEVIDLLSNFRGQMGITANLPGTTVARIRMDLFSANGTAGSVPFFVGIRKTTMKDVAEAAADATYALNVNPSLDAYNDWLFWRAIYPNHGADATTGLPNASTYEFDIKSMRRLDEPGETVALFLGKGASTGTLSVFTTLSVLLALP